jgi:hypothetical protein
MTLADDRLIAYRDLPMSEKYRYLPQNGTVQDPSTGTSTSLAKLLETATAESLRHVIKDLTHETPHLERLCITLLLAHNKTPDDHSLKAATNQAWALWFDAEDTLSELANYGGPDEDYEKVGYVLEQLAQVLSDGRASDECRQEIQALALKYLATDDASVDQLYDVAKACCHTDEEFRQLAQTFEATDRTWSFGFRTYKEQAMQIYRQIGDRDRYLALRLEHLESGRDFFELATFYAESGEMDKAVLTAEQGLAQTLTNRSGNGTELRTFLAEHALSIGDRNRYMELQFANATDRLTLEHYKRFKQLCTPDEWQAFEPRVLSCLETTLTDEKISLWLYREQFDKALAALLKDGPSFRAWPDSELRRNARVLETRYPTELLNYYLHKLGSIKAGSRRRYAEQAHFIADIKRVMLDHLGNETEWVSLTARIKSESKRLPAFRDELKMVLPNVFEGIHR